MPACPKPEPRVLAKARQKREAERAWRDVCRQVKARDGGKCRVCGKRGTDPHHIIRRGVGPDTTDNVLWVCRQCHEWQRVHLIRITGNADLEVRVWYDARVSPTGKEQTVWR